MQSHKLKSHKLKGNTKLGPIGRVPNEIASLIFSYATSECPLTVSNRETIGYANMEVVISHVCRHWRNLSLGLPSLRTTFYYVDYMANTLVIAERLSAYLARSCSQLLNIWIDLRGNSNLQRCIELIKMTITHIHRWRQFLFTPANNFPIDDFFLLVKYSAAPNLELFSLMSTSQNRMRPYQGVAPNGTGPPESWILKDGAPKLKTLWIDTSVGLYLPPTQNITTLYVKQDESTNPFTSWRMMLPLLLIPNLTTLTLDTSVDTIRPGTPLIYPHLKTLRICNQDLFSGMRNWRAEHLESLIFENVRFHGVHDIDSEHGRHAFPSLCRLVSVDSTPSDQQSGVILTRLTSNIKELLISDSRRRLPHGDYFLVNLLSYHENANSSKILWPALQKITLNIRSVERWGPTFFFDCFQGRPQQYPITLELDISVIKNWREESRTSLEELEYTCTVNPLDSSASSIHIFWPVYTGPFAKSLERFNSSYVRKYSYEKLLS